MKIKLKKGDKVKVMVGKDKGREGQVEEIFPKTRRVKISGVNLYKKHARARDKEGKGGGIIDIVRPLPVANVVFLCPKCGKAAKLGFKILKDGKMRICRKCQEVI